VDRPLHPLGRDEAIDVALAHALLRRAAGAGDHGSALRVYRPHTRIAAFGRRDTLLPGFPAAVRAAREANFTPVVRAPGGRAVAYTERALVVDHVSAADDAIADIDGRFRTFGALWARVLRDEGIDARVGAVPGEYCPGAYSVNGRGEVKLVGTAQRVVRGGWLFSAVAIFDDADSLRPLLVQVYRALGVPFSVRSVGSATEEAPGLSLDRLEAAVIAAYHDEVGVIPSEPEDQVLSIAGELLADHRVVESEPA